MSKMPAETEDERRSRLAWEAARTEEGIASIRMGRTVSFEAVKAWVDSWDTPNEWPKPHG